MIDVDLIQARVDHFHSVGFLTYEAGEKVHALLPASVLFVLKIFSLHQNMSFPRISAHAIRGSEVPEIYTTPKGEQYLEKYLSVMSQELFDMVVPIYAGKLKPHTFVQDNPRTWQNIKGLVGATTRTKPKPPLKIHLLIDNSEPFEYLKGEYIWDSIFEARTFINKLVTYVPLARLELWRVRTDVNTGRERKDRLDVLITKNPYKME